MRDSAILRTLQERDRWVRRLAELRAASAGSEEVAKADRQVAYYNALAEDMKRQVRPATTRDFLQSLFS